MKTQRYKNMKMMILLCLFFRIVISVSAWQSMCYTDVEMSCQGSHRILITNISATHRTADNILLQCNAHQTCEAELKDDECVEYEHFCIPDIQNIMQIPEASEAQLQALALLNVMSEKYQQGHEMGAKDIQCELSFADRSPRTMQLTIFDFASFANSDGYCLKVHKTEKKPFCSGSQKLHMPYGLFNSSTGFQFSIAKNRDSASFSKVRFWFLVVVSPNDVKFLLKCSSKEETNPWTEPSAITPFSYHARDEPTATKAAQTGTTSATDLIVAVLGTLLTVTLVAVAIGAGLSCRKKKKRKKKLSAAGQRQSTYMAGDPPYIAISDRNDVAISRVTLAETITPIERIGPISKSCQHIPGFSVQDRKLPSPPRLSHLDTTAGKHPLLPLMIQGKSGEKLDEVSVMDPDSDDEYVPPSITQVENDYEEPDMEDTKKKETIQNGEHHDSEQPQRGEQGESPDDDRTPQIEDQVQEVQEICNSTDESAEKNLYNPLDQESLIPPEERNKPTIYVPLPEKLSEENAAEIIEEPGECAENAEEKKLDESVTKENASNSD